MKTRNRNILKADKEIRKAICLMPEPIRDIFYPVICSVISKNGFLFNNETLEGFIMFGSPQG